MNTFGIYIHIPFCRKKCPYCDFYSKCGNEIEYEKYTAETLKKIINWSNLCNKKVTSIYFGGGTPSVIGAERLCAMLDQIKKQFCVDENAEVTCEVNPESGKGLDFELMRKTGFNRISVGLQSADENELKALGRIHTAEEARLTAKLASQAGINNISFDLMMGIPFQTLESLKYSIDFCADCGVTHISSYLLKIEKGTKFFTLKDKLPLSDDDIQADLYLNAVDELERRGYAQYEISNFAKPGYEGKHNINYWKCGEYIGIGSSAHSFFDGKRFYYERNIQDYYDRKIVDDGTGGDSREYIMLSLRLKEGLVFSEFERRYAFPVHPATIQKIKNFAKHGFMELDSEHACFTKKGFLVSNSIISELI
ncbi:MAG: radical SAM family heme chaperone HemW [Ruminococcus sp.]|nr:radical SAM family heme chaperone HemW [Ruminococcus sp.]